MRRPARILHAPWNIGGNPVGLSRGERELGFRSDVLVLDENPFGYEADINLGVGSRADAASKRRRIAFLVGAVMRYDVFHFNFGQTIFHSLDEQQRLRTELPWLRRLGKRILATFQGDDARPPSANPFAPYTEADIEIVELIQPQRRELMLHYADRVFFLNPDLREWLPGAEFRPYASFDPRSVEPPPQPESKELVVAHAPSNRKVKGTDRVEQAVRSLRDHGIPVRLELIEGVPRSEALERTALADVIVDQLNIGWYGGYAVEAMALGRPVLSYIRGEGPVDNPMGEELPVIRTNPETLADDLRAILGDRERRRELGAAGRAFVERHHDPRLIARQNLEGLVPIPAQGYTPPPP